MQEVNKLKKELDIQKRDYEKPCPFPGWSHIGFELQKLKDAISKLETDLKASEIRMKSYAPGGSEAKNRAR